MTDDITAWIRSVHEALAPSTTRLRGAQWGPVRMRHRTTRPEWYGPMDLAWAFPLEWTDQPDVDVISGSLADVPGDLRAPSVRLGQLGPRGEVPLPADSPTRVTWNVRTGEILAWDPESGAALLLRPEAPSGLELVNPMRSLVHVSVVRSGGMLVHAAAIGQAVAGGAGGVLLLGASGYGKSTSAMACASAGWVTCGDDAVPVFCDQTGWHALSVYAAFKTKIGAEAPADMPPIGAEVVTWEVEGVKRVYFLATAEKQTLAKRIDLLGVVLLDPLGDSGQPLSALSPLSLRRRAAFFTVGSMPYENQRLLARFGEMCEGLPAFELPRRSTMAQTVADLTTILDQCQPRISVIIPVHNGERFVAEAIDSVLSQTVGRFEIIVVNDASTDDSLAAVQGCRPRVEGLGHVLKVVNLPSNVGIPGARNAGLEQVTSDFISFLDQDDLWPPGRTAALWGALRRSGASMAQGRMTFEDLAPETRRPWVRPEWFEAADHPGHVVGAVLCRSELVRQVGSFDAGSFTRYDDVDWLMRVRDAAAETVEVPVVAVRRRIHEHNSSQGVRQGELLAAVRSHVERLRESGR